MTYLRNCWYVAAWDDEVKAGALFMRKLLDEKVLLYRNSSGVPVAIANRCPHRFAPLHLGKLVGDRVQCAYHGLEFDGSGRCVHNPQSDVIPDKARVRGYPVVEKYSLIWIWMGDSANADAALIPDCSLMDPAHYWVGKRYLLARANYVLESDNIMDLTHIEYLHGSTLGSEAIRRSKGEVLQQGKTVWSNRITENEVLPAFLYNVFGLPMNTPVDRWLDVRWDAPAVMLLLTGATLTGRPRAEGAHTERPSFHLFTPETATTTHYWFSGPFPKSMGEHGRELAEKSMDAVKVPFEMEDLPMLEAQQQSMEDCEFWDLKPVLLPGDAGAIRARRVLDQMIAEEQAAARALK